MLVTQTRFKPGSTRSRTRASSCAALGVSARLPTCRTRIAHRMIALPADRGWLVNKVYGKHCCPSVWLATRASWRTMNPFAQPKAEEVQTPPITLRFPIATSLVVLVLSGRSVRARFAI